MLDKILKILNVITQVILVITAIISLITAYVIFAPDELPKPFRLVYDYQTTLTTPLAPATEAAVEATAAPQETHEFNPILNPHIWIAGRKEHQQDPVARQMAIQATMKAIVPVTVILGAVDLPLKELIHLAPGDVIELNTNIDSPLVVQVANKKQFYARVGKSRKRLGVQITRVYREQDEVQMGF